MFGILFAQDYTESPRTGLYDYSEPSLFIFRDSNVTPKGHCHHRLLRASDILRFQVVARVTPQSDWAYRGAYTRILPFLCDPQGMGVLLRRAPHYDIFQVQLMPA